MYKSMSGPVEETAEQLDTATPEVNQRRWSSRSAELRSSFTASFRVISNYGRQRLRTHSSGAVWESRWTSWAVRPNEPSGFRGRKELLNRASALVTTCP